MTERTDEREMLRALVKKLALNVEAPLVLDSTEADVLKDALEQYPGRAIINSINMENGRLKIDSVMPLAMAHGAAVVAMTIDEEGMAKTARAQAGGGAQDPRHRGRRVWAGARGADLRPADLPALDR